MDYGEPGFVVSYDAGYMGLMENPRPYAEKKMRGGYLGLGRALPALRAFPEKARNKGLPIEPFEPLLDEVELRWNAEGQLAYFKSERYTGYWGRKPEPLGDVEFPINVSSRHGSYLVRFTFSEELTPEQMKTYHDMLKALIEGVGSGDGAAEPAIDPDALVEPIVMVERERYAVCASMLHKTSPDRLAAYERELGELVEEVEDALEDALEKFEENPEHKGALLPVAEVFESRRKREGPEARHICNPFGPRWDSEGEHALARFMESTVGLNATVVFAMKNEQERERLRGPMGEAFFPVPEKVFEELRGELRFTGARGAGEGADLLLGVDPGIRWLMLCVGLVLFVSFLLFVGRRGSRDW